MRSSRPEGSQIPTRRALLVGAGAAFATSMGVRYSVVRTRPRVSVTDLGARGDGVTDDTMAVRAAVSQACREGRPLWFPKGRYLVDAPIVVRQVQGFAMAMDGVLVRRDGSARQPLLSFQECVQTRITSVRVDGNVRGNPGPDGLPIDEVRHSVRFDGCLDTEVEHISGVDSPGDVLYLAGGGRSCSGFFLRELSATSVERTGRNGVSVIAGDHIEFGDISCRGSGYPHGEVPMPGGFQIEPNPGDRVSDISVSRLEVLTAGATGLGLYSAYGQHIRDVHIANARVEKLPGTPPGGCDVNILGCTSVQVDALNHVSSPQVASRVLAVSGSSHLTLGVRVPRVGPHPLLLGAGQAVSHLALHGAIGNGASDLVRVMSLRDSSLALTGRDPGPESGCIAKDAQGISSDVEISGDLTRGSRGAFAIGGPGTVQNWVLRDLNLEGWPEGRGCTFLADGSAMTASAEE